jgi:hypothetical protein
LWSEAVTTACRILAALACAACLVAARPAAAQVAMPDPSQISGVPLPASDVPAGTITVRVIRGSFANNLTGVDVTFDVDGQSRVVKTDANGRAKIDGLSPGTRVTARTVVDGQPLQSQPMTIGAGGFRVVLAATDAASGAQAGAGQPPAAGPAVKGTVAFGPNSRIVAEFSSDQLNVYYVLQVVNTAGTPVDTGGPLIVDLPSEALGASLLEQSSPNARVSGTHVIVTGPFPPGQTNVNVGFGLPYSGPVAHLEQRWPIALPQVAVFALKTGALDIASTQITNKRTMTQQGEQVLVGTGPGVAAGQVLAIDVTGLPYHHQWPRYTALAAASVVMAIGLWAAFGPASRRQAA